jgi:hypothetical protein
VPWERGTEAKEILQFLGGGEEQFRRSDKIGDQSDKKCEKRQGRVAVPGASRERNVMHSSCVSRVETDSTLEVGKGGRQQQQQFFGRSLSLCG